MANSYIILTILSCLATQTLGYHNFFNPYVKVVRYTYPPAPTQQQQQAATSFYSTHSNYINHVPVPTYNPYVVPQYAQQQVFNPQPSPYDAHINSLPTINIFAQKPYSIEKSFTVVPMLVVPEDNLNMISNGHISSISKKKPLVTLKTNEKDSLQCTPAVRIILEVPLTIYSLKSSIMFPSKMNIYHENVQIPIKVGAVIVPVAQDTYVTDETPITVSVVYAIPTKPIQVDIDDVNKKDAAPMKPVEVDYVNNDRDVVIDNNSQSVIVESNEGQTTPSNSDDDDDELVNRNPPSAPAGIVQSTQPGFSHLAVFKNPKESSVLTALREESKKRI